MAENKINKQKVVDTCQPDQKKLSVEEEFLQIKNEK